MIPSFQVVGILTVAQISLRRFLSWSIAASPPYLIISALILSFPAAFQFCRLCMTFLTSSSVMASVSMSNTSLAIIILSLIESQLSNVLAASFPRIIPTPLSCNCSPEYSIVAPSDSIRPLSVHLISLNPRICCLYDLIPLSTCANLPVMYKVLTFHLPILVNNFAERNCSFRIPTSGDPLSSGPFL